jgi:hypothetical protein
MLEGDVLRAGDRVELHSLQAKPEHNGKTGTLVAFNAASGRWQVDLAGGGRHNVRAANLTKLPSAGQAMSFQQARANVHKLLRSAEWSGKWLAVLDDLPAPSQDKMEDAGLGWMLGEFPWEHGRTIITTRAAAWVQEEAASREVRAAEQRRCDRCGRGGLSGTMMKCGRCRLVYYCSVDCQTAAWGEHKGACAPRRSMADVTGLSVGSFGE